MVAIHMFRSLVLFSAMPLMLACSEESFLQFPGLAWYDVMFHACLCMFVSASWTFTHASKHVINMQEIMFHHHGDAAIKMLQVRRVKGDVFCL